MKRLSVLAASLVAMLTVAGSAQLAGGPAQEEIDIPVGAIFEIQGVVRDGAEFSWVLSRGQDFLEASRSHVFQARIAQAGTYTLEAQIGDGAGGIIAIRTFMLNVRQRRPEDARMGEIANVNDIVTFTPPAVNGEIRLAEGKQTILASHAREDITVLAIDLDTQSDSNGDGNTMNDDETKDTLFRAEGNPLHLWFPEEKERSMKAGALLEDGTTRFQDIRMVTGASASVNPQDNPESPTQDTGSAEGEIAVLKSDNGKLQFAFRPAQADDGKPKLYLWNFGDGGQSLLDRPVHTYAEGGTFTVSVSVRDLQSGKPLFTVKDDIVVNRLQQEDADEEEVSDEPSEEPEEEEEEETSSGGGLLSTVVKILLGLVVSAGIGIGAIFLIGKVRKKGFSLEKTMEQAEKKVVGTPPVPGKPLTMEVIDEVPAPPQEPATLVEEEPPVEPPAEEKTPEWLKSAEAVPQQPVAEPETPVAPPAPAAPHTPMEPSADQLKADVSSAPAWLKAGIQTAEAKGQTVTAPPPVALAADTPTPEPETVIAAIPTPEPSVAPVAPIVEESVVTTPVAPAPAPTPAPAPAPAPATSPVTPLQKPAEQKAMPAAAISPQAPVAPAPSAPTVQTAEPATEAPVDAAAVAEREARLREKKRQKRQRYRENKKAREAEGKSTDAAAPDEETVAIIKAEDVAKPKAPPPPPPAPPAAKSRKEDHP
ncbi:PKD domain-containing protein [Candidatus Peregrinibacteria bacterium]|nr:PKD domain-containing protein [Candidatus Peregrinibacteria bacterium]